LAAEVITILEVYNAVNDVLEIVRSDDDNLPAEVIDVLRTFGDSEQGNNDVENLLVEIRDNLVYDPVLDDEHTSAISEVSQRLEVMDKRLDTEFQTINGFFSLLGSLLLAYFSVKFVTWILRPFTV